ncbi:MAG TPA: thiol reductant ABC exporter subunit CydC [Chloroflexi bacterium]|nr:thiol reductant ABC exporter subunit CydC [Chloroflexota bacterium]
MRAVARLLGFLRPFWREVLLAIALGVAAVASGIGLLGLSADIIARAALRPSIAELQVAIVGVRFFGLSRAVFRYLERLVSHSVNFRLLAQLRAWFFQKLEPLAPARLQGYQSGDLLSRSIRDVETLEDFYVRVVSPPLVALVTGLGVSLYFGQYAPLLGTAVAAGLFIAGAVLPAVSRRVSRPLADGLAASRARLNAALVEGLQGLSDLAAWGQEQAFLQRAERLDEDYLRRRARLDWTAAAFNALGLLVSLLTMLAVLWITAPLVRAGEVPGHQLAVFVVAALASFESVSPLALAAQQLEKSLEAARRLFELVDAGPEVAEPASPAELPVLPRLSVKGLCFAYPGGAGDVLRDLSFDLPYGKKLAIVGPSGAGKSTLFHLLVRFWEVQYGEIRLGGRPVQAYSPASLRRMMAVISQNGYIFNGTLRYNLLLADPGADEDQLWDALALTGLQEWARNLPEGLDTWLGEHGAQISGGERQRLLAARALLQKADLYLLDEPTANLDVNTERDLVQVLTRTLAPYSVIWVTHRLVSMDWMDEILVLEGGQVVQRGTHAELLAREGLYRRLWQAQQRPVLFVPGADMAGSEAG